MKRLEEAIYVIWEESERGFGVRPDGCSLHLTVTDYKKFVDDYWSKMPDTTPDEYSRPGGFPMTVNVSKDMYAQIKESKNGIRLFHAQEQKNIKRKEIQYK